MIINDYIMSECVWVCVRVCAVRVRVRVLLLYFPHYILNL